LKNLDSAVLRRFAFKVAFHQPLTEEGRIALFERYFPSAPLSPEARTGLATLSMLTPGDFIQGRALAGAPSLRAIDR
jgi:AAA+ superfamily predicted ATPase